MLILQNARLPIRVVSTSDTITDADNGKMIVSNAAGAITLSPTALTGIRAGFSCLVVQKGAGLVSIAAGAGVTLNSSVGATPDLAAQNSIASIVCTSDNVVVVGGDIVA